MIFKFSLFDYLQFTKQEISLWPSHTTLVLSNPTLSPSPSFFFPIPAYTFLTQHSLPLLLYQTCCIAGVFELPVPKPWHRNLLLWMLSLSLDLFLAKFFVTYINPYLIIYVLPRDLFTSSMYSPSCSPAFSMSSWLVSDWVVTC